MAQQFGERIPDDEAYKQARGALKHISDLSKVQALADTPAKQAALTDEQRERENQN